MSKARSPREVCSTTIGTSGLMALASFAVVGGILRGRRTRASLAMAPWRSRSLRSPASRSRRRAPRASFSGVQSFSRALRLLHADRLGALHEQVHGLAHGDVLAQRVVASLLLARARTSAAGPARPAARPRCARRRRAAPRRPRRRSTSMLLGLDDRGEHGLALQRALGLGLGLDHELLLGLADELEVALRVDALALEPVRGLVPHLVGLRVDELLGEVDLGGAPPRRPRRPRGTPPRSRAPRPREQLRLDVGAQLVERVVAAGLDREVVVQLGQPLLLDLLDGGRRTPPPCRRAARPGSRPGR